MRRLVYIFGAMILLIVFVIPASAHPGKTDSSGGHIDRSTGEYHYHHGYPAHDHYDMDGDGKKDCPYSFNDNTNYNSGKSNGSTHGGSRESASNNIPLILVISFLSIGPFLLIGLAHNK